MNAILAFGAAALLGCGDDTFEAPLRYRMIGLPAASAGACPATVLDAPPALAGATHVRLTYLDAGTNDLRCDVVLALSSPPTVIAVPDASRPTDLIVEYVDVDGNVLGRGAAAAIDLGGTGDVDVRIVATNAWSCAPERGLAPRAFHSATPLPNGELLLLGGLGGPDGSETIDPAAGFFLQPRAEIYSPDTGRSRVVTIAGLVPRAFHQAYVVASDADGFTIAVVGGLTITGDPATTPVAVVGGNFRIDASPMAVGAGGELLRFDTATSAFTRTTIDPDVERRAFGGLAAPGSEALAYVGGLDLEAAPPPPVQSDADRIDPATGLRTTTIGTRRQRVGASVTALSPDQLLVWGGDPTAGDGTGTAEVGELFTAWSTAPSTQQLTIDPAGAGGPDRAFHTAALAGDGTVIVAGGFRMTVGVATAPVPATVQRLTPGAMLLVTTIADSTAAIPHGYGATLRLADGDVLIAGGNPDPVTEGCPPENQGLVCAIGQALRFDSGGATIAATGSLGVARYGHQLSLLADGTVAATGGLAVGAAGGLHAVLDVELYEPRGLGDDPLLPEIVRMPGDVARTGVGEPLAPCAVVIDYPDAAP